MKRALTQAFAKGDENLKCEFQVTLKNNYLHMKFNFLRFILLLSVVGLLSACLNTTDTTTTSVNPCFQSLKFASMDSVPYISTASFTLEYDAALRDSVIVNLDSLPYKTRIDSVYPTFGFKSSVRQRIIYNNTDTIALDGTDTINFARDVKIENLASDKAHSRVYHIKVNVHQVKPELYVWKSIAEGVDSHNATSQKAIIFTDTIFHFLNNGTNSYLYKSADGKSWEELSVSGLPVNTPLNDMQVFNGKLYLTQNSDKIYSSANCRDWSEMVNSDYEYSSLLFVFKNTLWAVVKSKTNPVVYRFATSVNGNDWVIRGELPANFPVKDFSAISFSNRINVPKVLVAGGTSSNGNTLLTRWSSENGVNWVDFSQENKTLDNLANGSTILPYDDKLLVFGKRKDNAKPYLLSSKDEGLSWQLPDSTFNSLKMPIDTVKTVKTKKDSVVYQYFGNHKLISAVLMRPKTYPALNSSTSLDEIKLSNRFYILGIKQGDSGDVIDVWTGKLNRKNFLRQ